MNMSILGFGRRVVVTLLTLSAWPCLSAQETVATPAALYEVTTELGMPHLEENLRYSITHENRCLTRDELHHLFPILRHPALSGCRLGEETRQDEGSSYPLVCEGNHGTSGTAVWRSGEHKKTGQLTIRLGGKNMTFYQRVTAIPKGPCG
jgi:hypothetical protein